MAPTIHSIARALPQFTVTNDEAAARLVDVFVAAGEDPSLVRQIFDNAGIDRRYLARPSAYYLSETSLTARNQTYSEVAREVGVEACQKALDKAGVAPEEVDLIVDTSCTGVMIPALDAFVADALHMRRDVRRLPLTEAGCAAGATSLAFAHDYLLAKPDATCLLLSTELPSLTLQLGDVSRANLVSAAIFGDGAAAVVVSNKPAKGVAVEHLAHKSVLFPNTTDIMGFDLRTEGFKIILSKRIPLLVRRHLREEVDTFLEAQGLSLKDMGFFSVHPGGTKVLDNVRDVLELDEQAVSASRRTLRDYGNLSSASVHFVTQQLIEDEAIEPGRFGLMIAMGPGFTVEMALLRGARG
ncbi:MAG: type III polyketide synthase [Planctomycetota bacterium]